MVFLIGQLNIVIVLAVLAIGFQEADRNFIANILGFAFLIIFFGGIILSFIIEDWQREKNRSNKKT